MHLRLFALLLFPIILVAVENADTKKAHPSKPEENGLRLEITAALRHSFLGKGSDGGKLGWEGAYLDVDVAVRNISKAPIIVPTTAYEGKPWEMIQWPSWGEGKERIVVSIKPPLFQRKTTAYSVSRFAPVTLAPGECVLILHELLLIEDRKHADTVKEVSVSFGVFGDFNGSNDWWKGHLEAYQAISQGEDPDEFIEKHNAEMERFRAEAAKITPPLNR